MTEAMASARAEPRKRLARRRAAERRFKFYGQAAIFAALAALATLIASIGSTAYSAFAQHRLKLDVTLAPASVDPSGARKADDILFSGDVIGPTLAAIRAALSDHGARPLPGRYARGADFIVTDLATTPLLKRVAADTALIGRTVSADLPVAAELDLFLKGVGAKAIVGEGRFPAALVAPPARLATADAGAAVPEPAPAESALTQVHFAGPALQAFVERLHKAIEAEADVKAREAARLRQALAQAGLSASERQGLSEEAALLAGEAQTLRASVTHEHGPVALGDERPSLILHLGGGALKVSRVAADFAEGEWILAPKTPLASAGTLEIASGAWDFETIVVPQSARKLSDATIVYAERLKALGVIRGGFNTGFFTQADSREPELAGILAGLLGSFFTVLVCLAVAAPLAIAAAIYLEEFAPRNRVTDFIEININNLAAVPAIVYGLLGAAVFLDFLGRRLGVPNFAPGLPLVAGLVLALKTMPTIIIAARAALKSVPPSIREAALGVGASKMQAVLHHVLPLAAPGVLTGTIIGMANALGESAPLVLIGMQAFVHEPPAGITSGATVLPVLIYSWSDHPERAFSPLSSAAIIVLLAVLVVMNGIAAFVRRRFERRW